MKLRYKSKKELRQMIVTLFQEQKSVFTPFVIPFGSRLPDGEHFFI